MIRKYFQNHLYSETFWLPYTAVRNHLAHRKRDVSKHDMTIPTRSYVPRLLRARRIGCAPTNRVNGGASLCQCFLLEDMLRGA
jgi:hypothetical protein